MALKSKLAEADARTPACIYRYLIKVKPKPPGAGRARPCRAPPPVPAPQRAHQPPLWLGLALAGTRSGPGVLGIAQGLGGGPGSLHNGGGGGTLRAARRDKLVGRRSSASRHSALTGGGAPLAGRGEGGTTAAWGGVRWSLALHLLLPSSWPPSRRLQILLKEAEGSAL